MPKEIRAFLKGFLSQWHTSNFTVEDIEFVCAEQFMMYRKARLFEDDMIAEKILKATHPSDHKRLGQHVSKFSQMEWDNCKIDIVHSGNLAKFTQNNGLGKNFLLQGMLYLSRPIQKILFGVLD